MKSIFKVFEKMPVNPGHEYRKAEEEYYKANTTSEKIRALENMYAKCPKHKGAENLLKEIKSKIAKLKEKLQAESRKKGAPSLSVKKEGAATVSLIGIANSGKSTILEDLTGVKQNISEYEFTTKKPNVAIMDYCGIKLQMIEMPAIFKGYSEKHRTFLSIIRNSDLIVIILDGEKSLGEQLEIIEEELKEGLIDLDGETKGAVLGIPCLIVVNKKFRRPKTKHKIVRKEILKLEIWKALGLIYVFTKTPGKERDFPPVALEKGSSVKELAEKVHKDFVKKFRFARIWGKSAKHNGANVGLNHELKEGDVVEFHLR